MEASEQGDGLPGKCKEWKALQPPGEGTITVRGWCVFQGSGWSQELQRRDSDDPRQLVLERVVDFNADRQTTTVKAITVEWIEETETEYDTVRILPDGPTIDVWKGA